MGYFATEQANLAANTKTANLMQGEQLEFIGEASLVRIFAVSSAADINLSVFADSDVLVDDQEIVNIGTTVNRSDHMIDAFPVAPGTRLFVTLRETGGVATVDTLVSIETDAV